MKIVTLCQCKEDSCCPVVKIGEQQVEIGEEDNTLGQAGLHH